MFIDTHAHLYVDSFSDDLDLIMSRAIDSGVGMMLMPNIDDASLERLHYVYDRYSRHTRPMLGLHPCSVKDDWRAQADLIFSHFNSGRPYCAVGEIGIDLYWDKRYRTQQEEAFIYQCRIAREHDLPIVIHSRDSMEVILALLEQEQIHGLKGVFHCFGGTTDQLNRVLELGFYIGLGGTTTYKKTNYPDVLSIDHLDRIVLETDAPYLPPTPYRGKRNESSYVILVARRLADIFSLPMEIIAQRTTLAAHELFGLE